MLSYMLNYPLYLLSEREREGGERERERGGGGGEAVDMQGSVVILVRLKIVPPIKYLHHIQCHADALSS